MRRAWLLLLFALTAGVGEPGRKPRLQRLWQGAERMADRLSSDADRARGQGRHVRAKTLRAASATTRLASDLVGRTGVEVGVGFRGYVGLPEIPGAPLLLNEMWTRGINFGWTQQRYVDSLEGRATGRDLPKNNFGFVLQTPVLMGSTTKRGGIGFGLHPPGAAAFVNGMYYEMELGAPGVFTLGVGHDKERGPYALHHLGVKLPFLPRFGPIGFQANFRFHVFNPRLHDLVEWSRPYAERVQRVSDRMNHAADRLLGRWLKRPPQGDGP